MARVRAGRAQHGFLLHFHSFSVPVPQPGSHPSTLLMMNQFFWGWGFASFWCWVLAWAVELGQDGFGGGLASSPVISPSDNRCPPALHLVHLRSSGQTAGKRFPADLQHLLHFHQLEVKQELFKRRLTLVDTSL